MGAIETPNDEVISNITFDKYVMWLEVALHNPNTIEEFNT